MKTGFVNIFGLPNAGKSTLLNALVGEKLAIVSPKVQTTRHRIKAILTDPAYQLVISDTPGIIKPEYKLHEKMMQAVKTALEDADLALLVVDVNADWNGSDQVFQALKLKVPAVIVINKADKASPEKVNEAKAYFEGKEYCKGVATISALKGFDINAFLEPVLALLPEGDPFYPGDELSDLPTKFFASELIREKLYQLLSDELPYETAVVIREFREKTTLVKIVADIVVQRESQKAIVLGEKGSMIKRIGTEARMDIEAFIGQKVFLELFVKVKPRWRENDLQLKEYGY